MVDEEIKRYYKPADKRNCTIFTTLANESYIGNSLEKQRGKIFTLKYKNI